MVTAKWQNEILAKSNRTLIVDRKHYFPAEDVNMAYLRKSSHHTVCSWKGRASYYNIVVDNKVNQNAAWYYDEPTEKSTHFKSYIAFSFIHGIEVIEDEH